MAKKVLLDEMLDGYEVYLQKHHYEAYSVKKLIKAGKKLESDYSVITYAKDNDMIMVTEDAENGNGCKENGFPYVLLDKEKQIEIILNDLRKYD